MTRVVQGITGFREYIVTMAESNIRKMAAANNKLRTYLSQEEASILDQVGLTDCNHKPVI